MRFPNTISFSGFDAPTRVEADIFELEVEGEIPRDLEGMFYRVAPENQFAPRMGDDIIINGDGMVTMFRFENGHVDYKSRYVRTEKFKLERAARRALFGAYRNPYTDDPLVHGRNRGTANTNIIWHGDKLLALKEDSRPVEVDPYSLETVGQWAYHGELKSNTASAHPKLDPVTGELYSFGYAAKGETTRDICFYVADAHGRLVREEWFEAPYAALLHDFVVTRDHVIFPVMPTTTDLERLKAGGSHWLWDPGKPTLIGIFPRKGRVEDIRWFEGPPRWAFHFFNGYSKGSMVIVDACVSEAQIFPFFYPDTTGKPYDPVKAAPKIRRWMFDLSSHEKCFREDTLWEAFAEFPRIDDRFGMQPYRRGYVIANDPSREFKPGKLRGAVFNTIVRYDMETGDKSCYGLDEWSTTQEPVFAPRGNQGREGEGYLLAVVNRYETMLSDLIILDAQKPQSGPIATVKLPIRLRNGVHGNWVPSYLLPQRA